MREREAGKEQDEIFKDDGKKVKYPITKKVN